MGLNILKTSVSIETKNVPTREQGLPLTIRYRFEQPEPRGRLEGLALWISRSLVLTGVARVSAVALALITTTFFFISSFAFSWNNIVKNVNVLWIYQLTQAYPVLYWVVFALNALTLLPAFLERQTRWCAELLLLVMLTIGMLLTRVYSLSYVELTSFNLVWSVAVTLPLLCFGAFDIVLFSSPELWKRRPTHWHFRLRNAFAAGALLAGWYCAVAVARYPEIPEHGVPYLPVFATSILLHGSVFAGMAALLAYVANMTVRGNFSARTRLIISLAWVWIFSSLMLRRIVTPALSFNDIWADIWAWSYPLTFLVLLAGWHVRRSATRNTSLPGRVEEILNGLLPVSPRATAVAAILAAVIAFAVPYSIERVDWNFLFQRLTAVLVWVAVFVIAWRICARPVHRRYPLLKNLVALGVFAAACYGLTQSSRLWRAIGAKPISQAKAAYSGMDGSFQIAQLAMHSTVRDDDRLGLMKFLRNNSMIGDPMFPPEEKLAVNLAPTPGPKPDIYVLVIDSLRRDYLSPYNPRVNFTPQIEAFATEQDTFVFQHAHTHYGGTALSEPAIWAGAMIPSKQYVQPFWEMNALEQLTTTDGYRRLYVRDMILDGLLNRFPNDQLLSVTSSEGGKHFGLDLRDEIREINRQPEQRDGVPVFVYAQPQNLHPVTLHELGNRGQPLEGAYSGFNARYADELRKADAAFGELIENLKATGKYDNSIVVLTSDHGDWLGEYGRWGHGDSLAPVITDVPLLIHLPSRMGRKLYSDTSQDVFLTDITPSLYYLLGHRELRKGEFWGRPLFTRSADEQKDYPQKQYFFASSYLPLYGVLEKDTQTLYVADAGDNTQSVFHIADDPDGLDNLIDKRSRDHFGRYTRDTINRLNAMYGYRGPQ
jgi:arylsulfatase A-like enzyme